MKIDLYRMIHPLLLEIVKAKKKPEIILLNENPHCDGAAIYAVNHSNKYDVPIVAEIVNSHVWILVGKQRLDLMDRIFFSLNGSVWVDRKDRRDRGTAKEKVQHLLNKGSSVVIFPEGTWNLTASKPMLPLYWGIVDIARVTGKPIVPLVLEYKDETVIAKFGEKFFVEKDADKSREINNLTEKMATIKWEIWEQSPVVERKAIVENEWSVEVKKRLKEYPKIDFHYELSCIRSE